MDLSFAVMEYQVHYDKKNQVDNFSNYETRKNEL